MPLRSPLAPLLNFERREPRSDDVCIDILYCGVCHSDLHFARDNWGMSAYPVVPGHEIVGRVTAMGAEVTKYKEDDIVGVIGMGGPWGTWASSWPRPSVPK